MIKTKHIFAYYENYGKPDKKYIELDTAINNFLGENEIGRNELIDIKYAPVGFFQENGGEGELEASALVIYETH